jgi:5-methylthioadenosine/S-adenosylhomocysteine deaminase
MLEKIEADLVINAGHVITMDASRRIIRDGAVAICGQDIVAIGKASEIGLACSARRKIDLPNGVLTPGLIDIHNHPADYLPKGLIDDQPQVLRLKNIVIPYEDALTEDEVYVAAVANFHDMIRHGTTTYLDAGSPHPAAVGRAVLDTGIRGTLASKTADIVGPFGGRAQTTESALDLADKIFEDFHGAADGRIRVFFDIDQIGGASDALAVGIRDRAERNGVGIVTHLVERKPEGDVVGYRNPNVKRLAELGLIGPHMVLTHIGWLPDADVELIGKAGSNVAHCAAASLFGGNGWVAHGVIPDLAAAGANIALGSDAAVISRFLDMLRLMHLTSVSHKEARRRPDLFPAHEMLEMATLNAAKAMGLADRIGSLERGKAADLVVFDTSKWQPWPQANPISDLVYGGSGSRVDLVLINGRIVHEAGHYVYDFDIASILARVDAVADAATGRLGLKPVCHWPIL